MNAAGAAPRPPFKYIGINAFRLYFRHTTTGEAMTFVAAVALRFTV